MPSVLFDGAVFGWLFFFWQDILAKYFATFLKCHSGAVPLAAIKPTLVPPLLDVRMHELHLKEMETLSHVAVRFQKNWQIEGNVTLSVWIQVFVH